MEERSERGLRPAKHMPAHLWNETYDRNMRQYMMNTQDRRGPRLLSAPNPARLPPSGFSRIARTSRSCSGSTCSTRTSRGTPRRNSRRCIAPNILTSGISSDTASGTRTSARKTCRSSATSTRRKSTFSDHCIGRLLDRVEQMGLLDNTVILFSTDHGTHLGKEGCVQKTPALLNRCVTQIPLIIRHPDRRFAGKRVEGLVSTVDYLPTFLSLLGVGDYRNVDGQDAWKLATGEAASLHEAVYSVFGDFGAVRNLDWYYFQNVRGEKPG